MAEPTPHLLTGGSEFEMSRFDWYASTVCMDPLPRLAVRDGLAVMADKIKPVAGRYGYTRGFEMVRQGDVLATVFEGLARPDFVVASGYHAHDVAQTFRKLYPGGSVSRADSARDFSGGAGFYDQVRAYSFAQLKPRGISVREIINHTGPQPARTLYLGSSKSETMVRVYEKWLEDPTYAVGTVRVEAQVRPSKRDRKQYAATATADDLWGFARWSRLLADELLGLGAPAAPARSERVSDLDKAINTMCGQYGARMMELLEQHQGDLGAWTSDILRRL